MEPEPRKGPTQTESKPDIKPQAKASDLETEPRKVNQQQKAQPQLSPELPPAPEPGEPHTLQFAVSKHNSATMFLVVAKVGKKYECLNSQGQRLFFPEAALSFLSPTQTQIPADFSQFNQPLPQDLLSDAVWGRMQLLATTNKEEWQEAKNRIKEHQEGLFGSLWKYWLTDEDKQQIEASASSVTSEQLTVNRGKN